MEYLIRACSREDLPSLVDLCVRHARYEKSVYRREGKIRMLGDAIFSEPPRLFCMVVESARNLVGFASYTIDFSTWDAQQFLYLDCLYLDEGYRGAGIGEVLMQRLISIGVESKCVNIQWQTPLWNERAIKFYSRIGGVHENKSRFRLPLIG